MFKKEWSHVKTRLVGLMALLFIVTLVGCQDDHNSLEQIPENLSTTVTVVATGLHGPMGMAIDQSKDIWVAETAGTVSEIAPDGTKSVAIINLPVIKNALSGETEGPSHLLFDKNNLYVLAGDDLFTFDLSKFNPANGPLDASTATPENIGDYVRSLNIVTPNDSHPYNLIKGPDGLIYILDAGANAIIKRTGAGNYSVFAKFPNLVNNSGVGGATIQAVPTGIIYDGKNFLVSTLSGFPFPAGQAVIYQVSNTGEVSIYKKNLTALVGIAEGNDMGHVILQIGSPAPATEFAPNSGAIMMVNPTQNVKMADGLNMPSGLLQVDDHTWYFTSLADGTLSKLQLK